MQSKIKGWGRTSWATVWIVIPHAMTVVIIIPNFLAVSLKYSGVRSVEEICPNIWSQKNCVEAFGVSGPLNRQFMQAHFLIIYVFELKATSHQLDAMRCYFFANISLCVLCWFVRTATWSWWTRQSRPGRRRSWQCAYWSSTMFQKTTSSSSPSSWRFRACIPLPTHTPPWVPPLPTFSSPIYSLSLAVHLA